MSNIKKLFETPKKAVISSICAVAILAGLGTGTAFVARAVEESSSIGSDNAQNFAFADAGVDPASAKDVHSEFDFKQGQFVYEVEFSANGSDYEYWIKASDGTVVKKDVEIVTSEGKSTTVTASISVDEAKEIALNDAGLKENQVTFTQASLDIDDGVSIYEIEFYSDNTEYEYEINANTGDILSKSKEVTHHGTPAPKETSKPQNSNKPESTPQATASNQTSKIGLSSAKKIALKDAGLSASEVTFTKQEADYDDGVAIYEIDFYTATHEYDYEIDAYTGKILDKDSEPLDKDDHHEKPSETESSSNSYIGLDKAKEIAVAKAGFKVSEVTFKKAKLDREDGHVVYEIEFYKNGMEYDCVINAITGDIMEYDCEHDD